MIEIIDNILEKNKRLLSAGEQSALRQRLEEGGNSQEAFDRELASHEGAYNWNRITEISLMVCLEECFKLLRDSNIPLPDHPDYVRAWGRVSECQHETTYPTLMMTFHLIRGMLTSGIEREEFLKEIITVFKDLVATQKDSLAEMGTSLTRTRQDKDELKAQQTPPAPPVLDPALCRDENEKHVPAPKLRAAREILSEDVCPDEEVREQAIYLIWNNKDNKSLYENTIRPLRRDQRMRFSQLPVRQQARLCELLLHRKDRDGFSQATLQSIFEVE